MVADSVQHKSSSKQQTALSENDQDHIEHHIEHLPEASVATAQGYQAGGLHCGLKRKRLDLGWIYSDVPAHAAGVYTTNAFQAAPLLVTQESIAENGTLQAVLVNSANANACTGKQGLHDAYAMRERFAEHLGLNAHDVAVTSTGVIGVPLPMDKVNGGIASIPRVSKKACETDWENGEQPGSAEDFEKAILTTDQTTKHEGVQLEIDGKKVVIGGAAKGSGMIEPNMATMLGFVTTDAAVEPEALSKVLKETTEKTFNMITVDGDTSTNDMVLLLANGKAQNKPLNPQHPQWPLFVKGLEKVCTSLAQQISRDGEGATKLVEVQIMGAVHEQGARSIAKSVIGSNLVKTAVYGADPNWGRIICAVGYSGVPIEPDLVSVWLGSIQVVDRGLPASYKEEEASKYLQQEKVCLAVDLNQGEASATAWGCDLSYEYVRINASYRT